MDSEQSAPEALEHETVSYCQRRTLLDKRSCYRIDGDTLLVDQPKDALTSIPLSDIKQVNLRAIPTREGSLLYRCTISCADSGKLKLTNRDYQGFAYYLILNESYAQFLRELHARLLPENTLFSSGMGSVSYYLGILLAVLAILLMLGLMAVGFVDDNASLFSKGLFGFGVLVPLIHYLRKRARPRTYSADNIPRSLLPPDTPNSNDT